MTQIEFIKFLETPQKDRDEKWENTFLKIFPTCKVTLLNNQPQVGPDRFPYMFIEIKEDSSEHAMNLLKWISENGIGLAINPNKSYPDFVLTFGMIWNFIKNGKFLTNPSPHVHGPNCKHDQDHASSGKFGQEQTHEHTLFAGTPSSSYLPNEIRIILKDFLKQQGVMAPKVIMLSPDKTNFDLCFSLEALGSPKNEEYEGILQALSWFLPAHYSLAIVSEQGLPPFEAL